ncbi:MAG TPA: pyridoxamine 5'-phosphate oxidase family protein [Hyphomonadaceae bacterium]|nr:pyridoxamine 5'-phosphate oxidase family protein [Hyphomonadaceae bacterium]
MSETYERTSRNTISRRPQRGRYDKASVHTIFDSVLIAHIGYQLEGQTFVTPTSFWREGETLYWHGSRAGRGMVEWSKGVDVCVTVAELDGFVLGRTGLSHSVNYRSAVAFGRTQLIDDLEGKARAMNVFIDRIYPGRSATLRPYHKTELAQISVIAMPIESAVAKQRDDFVNEKPEDLSFPGWAGVLDLATRVSGVRPDTRGGKEGPQPDAVKAVVEGHSLSGVLLSHARTGEIS